VVFRRSNEAVIQMTFQGLTREQAEAVWRPFFEWIAASPQDFTVTRVPRMVAVPALRGWDASLLGRFPGIVVGDDRPGASERNFAWAGDAGQAGQFVHGINSAWLPATLLDAASRERLSDALFAATRHWGFELHFNKGLAGAPVDALTAARDTAMNPAVVDAFALLICGAMGPPAYPGVVDHEPDVALARRQAAAIERAMHEVRTVVPDPGSYAAESNFFEPGWQRAHWGSNYRKLLAIKDTYDPDGLFIVHHGVGSERWSADGFTRQT
jgi:hypothetical protein